jgi:hypothetical protein
MYLEKEMWAEAEAAFLMDLSEYPENTSSLSGLAEAMRAGGDHSEEDIAVVQMRADAAGARSDFEYVSACLIFK